MQSIVGPTVDVIVANYNYEQYVGETLDSLLAQTPSFNKIIVVNDGSTDNSLEVLRQYEDRVSVLDIPNGGQLGAFIRGLAESDADYVYFLDADDVAEPHLTQILFPLLQSNPVKVQFRLGSINADGVPTGGSFPAYPPNYTSADMQDDNLKLGYYITPPTSGNVFRTQYLRDLKLETFNSRDWIDQTPSLIAPYFGNVISLNDVLARYRVHDSNVSQWGHPSLALLAKERDQFFRNWEDACRCTDAPQNVTPQRTAFALERDLMTSVLEGRRASLSTAVMFCRRILGSHMPTKLKIANCGWALLLCLTPGETRKQLVFTKRSPTSRPKLVERLFRPRSARSAF
ncbi:MAG: glycosyltransferase [Alphaproteobacteria bacterium]